MEILCLQEHWLWSYQADKVFTELLQNRKFAVRSTDEFNKIPPGPNIRGHGGVAVSWKDSLDPFIQVLKEGIERILPIIIKLEDSIPVCLICCYLPSGSDKNSVNTFSEDMALLDELICKYKGSHSILIAGDLNADILNRDGRKEKILKRLIAEQHLYNLNQDLKDISTYKYEALSHASHLDYFLTDGKIRWRSTTVLAKETTEGCTNTSSHIPILTETTDVFQKSYPKGKKKEAARQIHCKIRWDKMNIPVYQDALIEEIDKHNFNNLSIEDALEVFTNSLHAASEKGSTAKKKRPQKKHSHKQPWSDSIKEASRTAKFHFWNWKAAGKPDNPHPLATKKKKAAKHLRAAQRQEQAQRRNRYLQDIMEAAGNDSRIFHKLIKANRGHIDINPVLRSGEALITDFEAQKEMWAAYFEDLSAVSPYPGDTEDEQVVQIIRDKHRASNTLEELCFTASEVENVIKNLNRHKAADMEGISAEHLIHATSEPIAALTVVINKIFEEATAPGKCTSGYKIPIPKRGKDGQLLTNYRGITITALVEKIVEHLLQQITEPILKRGESHLQFGFTKGLSPTMATLCLNEAIATAKQNKKELFITTLDAQKAFDVVNHNKLKQKLHTNGIVGQPWLLIDSLYSNVKERVRWKMQYSREFEVGKGVRQGAIMSTSLYKLYINDLLEILMKSGNGLHLGTIYVGSPTCADDILLISNNKEEMQAMINTCYQYAKTHQYSLHPQKSTVTAYMNIQDHQADYKWKMGSEEMANATAFSHLGLEWKQNQDTPSVEDRIRTARNTVYSLMGAGVHGVNGLSPAVSNHIIKIYVIPRLLYGLDAVVLSKKQRDELNNYHRHLLRQIQGLPPNTACETIYILLGEIPVEGELDIRILTLYGAICRAEENELLQQLSTRQLSSDNKHSWFYQVLQLCIKYGIDLPSTRDAPWRKNTWKEYVASLIRVHWKKKMIEGIMSKTSTIWLNLRYFKSLQVHPIWSSCKLNPRLVPGAMIRAKLLTKTYMVQERKAKFSKGKEDPLCQLCQEEDEDITHFLLKCNATSSVRSQKLDSLQKIGYRINPNTSAAVNFILNGPEEDTADFKVNKILNEFCLRLHSFRFRALEDINLV
jgi:hypothetical protein